MATEDKLNDYDFTGTDAGASHTIPSEAGQIRKGGYIVIKGHPCKVSSDNGLSLKSVPTLLAVRTEHFGVTWYARHRDWQAHGAVSIAKSQHVLSANEGTAACCIFCSILFKMGL